MTRIQTLARRSANKHSLAAMPRQLLNRGKINSSVPIAAPDYKAHVMALFGQFSVQDFDVGLEVFESVSFHG
jgi:hypothetical protein